MNRVPAAVAATLVLLVAAASSVGHATDEPLVRGIELPAQAERLRAAGVPAAEVKTALTAIAGAEVPASEAADVLQTSADDAEKGGPIDNFGSFVKERVGEGLRGRDLARAIHDEHARRGQGKPPKDGEDGKTGKGKGPPDDRGGEGGGKGGKGKAGGGGGKGGKGKGGH